MIRFLKPLFLAPIVMLVGAMGFLSRASYPEPLDMDRFTALYDSPAQAPSEALGIFHLGHSLVARDMPAMLAQLAGAGHTYDSQLGWGTFLKAHWDPEEPITGFDEENDHPRFRAAHEAVSSGAYDVVVLTEAVEIKDSIKYKDSARMLHNWAEAVWAANPNARVYFYETWHNLDDAEGWLERLDRDLELYWEGQILRPALGLQGEDIRPIYMIPGGQVMARVVREIEARGGVGPLQDRSSLFSDTIHFNDYGAYLMALTHYAVLYQRSPLGLPHDVKKADGTQAASVGPEAASLMQELVWEVVTSYPQAGVTR